MSAITKMSTSNTSPAQDKTDAKQNYDTQLEESNEKQQGDGPDKETPSKRPSKRRKVNHACVYCRRSHMTCDQARPCSRCIKRNIPHLCHDEPRDSKRSSHGEAEDKDQEHDSYSSHEGPDDRRATVPNPSMLPSGEQLNNLNQETGIPPAGATNPDVPGSRVERGDLNQSFNAPEQVFNGLSNVPPDQLQGIQINPLNNMFNTSEINTEYNLINNFLTSSLLEDGAYYPGDDPQLQFSDPSLANLMGPLSTTPMVAANGQYAQQQPPANVNGGPSTDKKGKGKETSKVDKAQEKYYMLAADPGGIGSTEERMNKLLKAKYEAGLLKPFNYINGYARLNKYMDQNMQEASRQKILHQLSKFRPKFRERMQSLTNFELVLVEIWFERKLMEYERVFASMPIPACCWRRTGEIFRGNREMAELIGVPVERLRDGKLAIHEFISEDSLVDYWVKFGTIAFDLTQKGILSRCVLKRPNPNNAMEPELKCCFSFTVQRDNHHIPSLIIGNFLPIAPQKGEK